MIRINLLPPEIIDKRRAERRWTWVVLAAVALYAVLAMVWFGVYLVAMGKAADVASKQQEAQTLQAQANSFKIFEDRQQDLQTRQATADSALAGRLAYSKLFNELALILPSDAWLNKLSVDEKVFSMDGQSVDSQGDVSSSGFKPIAKLLVHMADMRQLENVWLTSSQKGLVGTQPVVNFSIGADLAPPADLPAAKAGAPAPPKKKK